MSHDVYLDVDFLKLLSSLSIYYVDLFAQYGFLCRIWNKNCRIYTTVLSNNGLMPMIFASETFCIPKLNIILWLINALAKTT